jgi:hypothetical protein
MSFDPRQNPARTPGALTRRTALIRAGALGAGIALIASMDAAAAPATPAAPPSTPGGQGLGLTQAAWEAVAGPGQVGQGARIYALDGLSFAARFDGTGGRLANLFWTPTSDQAGMPLADALAQATRFLPADAALLENYDVPGAGIGPIAFIQLYRSAALQGAYSSRYAGSGNFVAFYDLNRQLISSANVVAIDLFVGTPPSSLDPSA